MADIQSGINKALTNANKPLDLFADDKKVTFDAGSKKFILGGTQDTSPLYLDEKALTGNMSPKTEIKIKTFMEANPSIVNEYKIQTPEDLYNRAQVALSDRLKAIMSATPKEDEVAVPVDEDKNVTQKTVAKADNVIGNYLDEYMGNKGKGLRFLYPIAEGFAPKATKYATSLFGGPVNKSLLSAIGGFASGLTAEDRREDANMLEQAKLAISAAKTDRSETLARVRAAQGFREDFLKSAPIKDLLAHINNYQTLSSIQTGKDGKLRGTNATAAMKAFAKTLLPAEAVMEGDLSQIANDLLQKGEGSLDIGIKKWVRENLSGTEITKENLEAMKNFSKLKTLGSQSQNLYKQTVDQYTSYADQIEVDPKDIVTDVFGSGGLKPLTPEQEKDLLDAIGGVTAPPPPPPPPSSKKDTPKIKVSDTTPDIF